MRQDVVFGFRRAMADVLSSDAEDDSSYTYEDVEISVNDIAPTDEVISAPGTSVATLEKPTRKMEREKTDARVVVAEETKRRLGRHKSSDFAVMVRSHERCLAGLVAMMAGSQTKTPELVEPVVPLKAPEREKAHGRRRRGEGAAAVCEAGGRLQQPVPLEEVAVEERREKARRSLPRGRKATVAKQGEAVAEEKWAGPNWTFVYAQIEEGCGP